MDTVTGLSRCSFLHCQHRRRRSLPASNTIWCFNLARDIKVRLRCTYSAKIEQNRRAVHCSWPNHLLFWHRLALSAIDALDHLPPCLGANILRETSREGANMCTPQNLSETALRFASWPKCSFLHHQHCRRRSQPPSAALWCQYFTRDIKVGCVYTCSAETERNRFAVQLLARPLVPPSPAPSTMLSTTLDRSLVPIFCKIHQGRVYTHVLRKIQANLLRHSPPGPTSRSGFQCVRLRVSRMATLSPTEAQN